MYIKAGSTKTSHLTVSSCLPHVWSLIFTIQCSRSECRGKQEAPTKRCLSFLRLIPPHPSKMQIPRVLAELQTEFKRERERERETEREKGAGKRRESLSVQRDSCGLAADIRPGGGGRGGERGGKRVNNNKSKHLIGPFDVNMQICVQLVE